MDDKSEIILELPYPPSVNHYKRVGRIVSTASGKTYQTRVNTDATKRFYFEVWMKIMQLKRQEGFKSFDDATISVEIDLHSPDNRKRDIDNPVKPILDSLQKAGMFIDDNQIARLLVTRCSTIIHGQIIVRIKPI